MWRRSRTQETGSWKVPNSWKQRPKHCNGAHSWEPPVEELCWWEKLATAWQERKGCRAQQSSWREAAASPRQKQSVNLARMRTDLCLAGDIQVSLRSFHPHSWGSCYKPKWTECRQGAPVLTGCCCSGFCCSIFFPCSDMLCPLQFKFISFPAFTGKEQIDKHTQAKPPSL